MQNLQDKIFVRPLQNSQSSIAAVQTKRTSTQYKYNAIKNNVQLQIINTTICQYQHECIESEFYKVQQSISITVTIDWFQSTEAQDAGEYFFPFLFARSGFLMTRLRWGIENSKNLSDQCWLLIVWESKPSSILLINQILQLH